MPEILPQPEDIILDKLQKMKCSKNCQNFANYLIYGFGLYCTQCLSQVKDVTPDQITNFSNLSKIVVNLVNEYNKNTKSEVSHMKVAKTETDKATGETEKLNKNLKFEIDAVKKRYSDMLNSRYKACRKEHTLEQLEELYEPDMSATMLMNETDLLIRNLQLLKITQLPNGQVEYRFADQSKHPKEVYSDCSKEYRKIKNVLTGATQKVKSILNAWQAECKKQ